VFQVTAITHRNAPILRGALLGRPTAEDHIFYSVTVSAVATKVFEDQGPEGVIAVYCPPEGDSLLSAIIQMKPHYVGHSRMAARSFISNSVGRYAKYVIVVDEDIDPFDLGQVWWAMMTRTQGSRDIEILRFGPTSRSDPSVPRDQAEYADKVIIDATKKLDYPYNRMWGGTWAPTAMPPKIAMDLADLKWRRLANGESGLDSEIETLTLKMETETFQTWEKWRKEAYTISEEEKSKEIALSYPKLDD